MGKIKYTEDVATPAMSRLNVGASGGGINSNTVKNVPGCHEKDKVSSYVHKGTECSGCGESPIVGIRYKCKKCPSTDICGKCQGKEFHGHHFLQKIFESHENMALRCCDPCGIQILDIGWRCSACPLYNGCQKCQKRGDHAYHQDTLVLVDYIKNPNGLLPKSIQSSDGTEPSAIGNKNLTKMPLQKYNNVHLTVACDGCGIKPIVGLRYKCKKCSNLDLCESCLGKDFHNFHAFYKILETPLDGSPMNFCETCAIQLTDIAFYCQRCPNMLTCVACHEKGTHAIHEPYMISKNVKKNRPAITGSIENKSTLKTERNQGKFQSQRDKDVDFLLNDIKEVSIAKECEVGYMSAYGSSSFPILVAKMGNAKDAYHPIAIGGRFKEGKIVAFAHDGFLICSDPTMSPTSSLYGKNKLIINSIKWVSRNGKKSPKILIVGYSNQKDKISELLVTHGGFSKPINIMDKNPSFTEIEKYDVICIRTGFGFDESTAKMYTKFGEDGGGLVVALTPWAHIYNFPVKGHFGENYSPNKLAWYADFVWCDSVPLGVAIGNIKNGVKVFDASRNLLEKSHVEDFQHDLDYYGRNQKFPSTISPSQELQCKSILFTALDYINRGDTFFHNQFYKTAAPFIKKSGKPVLMNADRSWEWKKCSNGKYPQNAVEGGCDLGVRLLVARAAFKGHLLPGKYHVGYKTCYIPWEGKEHVAKDYEILCWTDGWKPRWVVSENGKKVFNAVEGGRSARGDQFLIGRFEYANALTPGRIDSGICYISYGDKEYKSEKYEILLNT